MATGLIHRIWAVLLLINWLRRCHIGSGSALIDAITMSSSHLILCWPIHRLLKHETPAPGIHHLATVVLMVFLSLHELTWDELWRLSVWYFGLYTLFCDFWWSSSDFSEIMDWFWYGLLRRTERVSFSLVAGNLLASKLTILVDSSLPLFLVILSRASVRLFLVLFVRQNIGSARVTLCVVRSLWIIGGLSVCRDFRESMGCVYSSCIGHHWGLSHGWRVDHRAWRASLGDKMLWYVHYWALVFVMRWWTAHVIHSCDCSWSRYAVTLRFGVWLAHDCMSHLLHRYHIGLSSRSHILGQNGLWNHFLMGLNWWSFWLRSLCYSIAVELAMQQIIWGHGHIHCLLLCSSFDILAVYGSTFCLIRCNFVKMLMISHLVILRSN